MTEFIVCPYTQLQPMTYAALSREGNARERNVSFWCLTSEFDYASLLTDLWQQQKTIIVVEHDIVPHEGFSDELLGCGSEWCLFDYHDTFPGVPKLGCTKISESLMRRLPSPWTDQDHWRTCDISLARLMEKEGITACWHYPRVAHVNAKTLLTPVSIGNMPNRGGEPVDREQMLQDALADVMAIRKDLGIED